MASKQSDPPVRAGIIGTGFLGKAMGREFGRNDRGTVQSVCDVSDENRRDAADEFGIPERSSYADYEEMLEEEPLDALVITTPHALHHEQILAGLDRDLHVACEKPMCTDLADAREIVERAEASDRVVMLGYQRHLDSAFIAAKEYWAESEDEPTFITAEVTQDWINEVAGSWKSNPELSGGGQLYDTGSHVVDAILWMTGLDPESVTAEMVFHDDERRVDTQAALTVRFDNDAVASIAVSGDTPRVSERIEIWGDEGATVVSGREWNPRVYQEVDEEGHIVDPNIDRGSVRSKTDAFIDAIETGEEPPATVRDGLRATALTEAAYEAAVSGERVDVELDERAERVLSG